MIRVGFRWLERGSCRHPEVMTLRGGSLCAARFPSLAGVIEHPTRGILLFDTGYDPAFLAATKPFPERLYRWMTPAEIPPSAEWRTWLATHGVDEAHIAGTIVSHFHGDHVAGLQHVAHLPVHCARAGLQNLRRRGRFRRTSQGLLPGLVPSEIDRQARYFEDAPPRALPKAFGPFGTGHDILGDGSLLAIELPGHCVGHWGLALRTTDDCHVLLAADAVWSRTALASWRPPPRLTTALLGDTRLYRATLTQLSEAHRNNEDLAILPSHCEQSAISFRGPYAA